MAPNRHRLRQVPLELKNLVHASKQQQQAADYKPSRPTVDASYWDWPAETPVVEEDVFCIDHIVSSLIEDSKVIVRETSSSLASSSDNYWAESSSVPQHTVKVPSNYWDEKVCSSKKGYWNESSVLRHHDGLELSKTEEATYFDEKSYDVHTSKSEDYWREETTVSPCRNYWSESITTPNDLYWVQ